MPSLEFMLRSIAPDGQPRKTDRLLADALSRQQELLSVIESVGRSIAREAERCRLVLDIEGSDRVMVDFLRISQGVSLGQLTCGQVQAVAVMVAGTDLGVTAEGMAELELRLAGGYPKVNVKALFEWLVADAPPRAALIYLDPAEPDGGIDTAVTCLACAFFRLCVEQAAGDSDL